MRCIFLLLQPWRALGLSGDASPLEAWRLGCLTNAEIDQL